MLWMAASNASSQKEETELKTHKNLWSISDQNYWKKTETEHFPDSTAGEAMWKSVL